MEPASSDFIDALNFPAAVRAELDTWRNLIPPEPWLEPASRDPDGLAALVPPRLAVDHHWAPSVTVGARKVGHSVRPVPIVGMIERVVYRTLTSHLLSGVELPTRSSEEYKRFVQGPINYAFEGISAGDILRLGDVRIRYVVEADIAAFYEYVDHEILRRELDIQTGRIEHTDRVLSLLAETEGEPSDSRSCWTLPTGCPRSIYGLSREISFAVACRSGDIMMTFALDVQATTMHLPL